MSSVMRVPPSPSASKPKVPVRERAPHLDVDELVWSSVLDHAGRHPERHPEVPGLPGHRLARTEGAGRASGHRALPRRPIELVWASTDSERSKQRDGSDCTWVWRRNGALVEYAARPCRRAHPADAVRNCVFHGHFPEYDPCDFLR